MSKKAITINTVIITALLVGLVSLAYLYFSNRAEVNKLKQDLSAANSKIDDANQSKVSSSATENKSTETSTSTESSASESALAFENTAMGKEFTMHLKDNCSDITYNIKYKSEDSKIVYFSAGCPGTPSGFQGLSKYVDGAWQDTFKGQDNANCSMVDGEDAIAPGQIPCLDENYQTRFNN
jgi:hypothetical protein